MPKLSDFINQVNNAQLTLGAACNQNDILELTGDGFLYPIGSTDTAALPNAGTVIVSPTNSGGATVVAGGAPGASPFMFVDPTYAYYYVVGGTGQSSVTITKYSMATGASVGSATASNPNSPYYTKVVMLSNGNLAGIACDPNNPSTTYWVLNTQLMTFVLNPTNPVNSNQNPVMGTGPGVDIAALVGGGFALVYWDPTNTVNRITTYNNSGVQQNTATFAASTAGNSDIFAVAGLSNGNIGILYGIYSGTPKLTIFNSTLGSVVLSPTSTTLGTQQASYQAWSLVLTPGGAGDFCAGIVNSSGYFSYGIYNAAGALQGSVITNTTGNTNARLVVQNDGTNYWAPTYDSNGHLILAKITTAGSQTTYTLNAAATSAYLGCVFDKGFNNLYIVTTDGYYYVFNSTLLTTVANNVGGSTLSLGVATNAQKYFGGMVYIGDGQIALAGSNASSTAFQYTQIKLLPTSIYGVALAACAKGSIASVDSSPGYKTVNAPKGTLPKTMAAGSSLPGQTCVVYGALAYMRGNNPVRSIN